MTLARFLACECLMRIVRRVCELRVVIVPGSSLVSFCFSLFLSPFFSVFSLFFLRFLRFLYDFAGLKACEPRETMGSEAAWLRGW